MNDETLNALQSALRMTRKVSEHLGSCPIPKVDYAFEPD